MTTAPRLRPRSRDELPAPVVDQDSATLLTEAIDFLAALRTAYQLGDARGHDLTGRRSANCSESRPHRRTPLPRHPEHPHEPGG